MFEPNTCIIFPSVVKCSYSIETIVILNFNVDFTMPLKAKLETENPVRKYQKLNEKLQIFTEDIIMPYVFLNDNF